MILYGHPEIYTSLTDATPRYRRAGRITERPFKRSTVGSVCPKAKPKHSFRAVGSCNQIRTKFRADSGPKGNCAKGAADIKCGKIHGEE